MFSIKTRSKRFGLKSFKALGGAYAVKVISKNNKKIIVSSATAESWKVSCMGSKKAWT